MPVTLLHANTSYPDGVRRCIYCAKDAIDQKDTDEPCDGPLPLRANALNFASAIRRHRDYRGDDRCWQDDEELYRVLPEGFVTPPRDSSVELELCKKYIACRHNPALEYVSPQREIERLTHELADATRELKLLRRTRDGQKETATAKTDDA